MKGGCQSLKKNRVLVIGLDGGSLGLVHKWIDSLPTFRRLLSQGASSHMKSTVPSSTPTAWTTFMTGKNPGKHGVFGFLKRNADNYDLHVINPNHSGQSTLWDTVSQSGLTVVSFDVPMTYPPEEVNGVMISGLGTPSLDSDFIYPQDMKNEIQSIVDDYIIEATHPPAQSKGFRERDEYLRSLHEVIHQRKKISLNLMENIDWDLFMVVFTSTDRAGHFYWKYMDDNFEISQSERMRYMNAIKDVYIAIDAAMSELLDVIDDGTLTLICSDHGFGPMYGRVDLDKWLESNGYYGASPDDYRRDIFVKNTKGEIPLTWLKHQDSDASLKNGLLRFESKDRDSFCGISFELEEIDIFTMYVIKVTIQTPTNAGSLLELAYCTENGSIPLQSHVIEDTQQTYEFRFYPQESKVRLNLVMSTFGGYKPGILDIARCSIEAKRDFRKTRAFIQRECVDLIYLNIKGREPAGIVDEGDYSIIRNDLKKKLLSLKDNKNTNLIKRIYVKDKLYSGAFFNNAPDLLVENIIPPRTDSQYKSSGPPGWSGTHRREGLLIAQGPSVIPGLEFDSEIADIYPTILYHLGIPIPDDVDGNPLIILFKDSEIVKKPNSDIDTKSSTTKKSPSRDEAAMIRRLESLGYL